MEATDTPKYDIIDIKACSDCIMLVANGETPVDMDEDETAAYVAEIADYTRGWDLVYGGDDLGFTYDGCDVCGSPLGGDRWRVHLMRRIG